MVWECMQEVELWYYAPDFENIARLNHSIFCWLGFFDPAELVMWLKAAQYFVIYMCLLQQGDKGETGPVGKGERGEPGIPGPKVSLIFTLEMFC